MDTLTSDFVEVGMVTGNFPQEDILSDSRLPEHLLPLLAESHLEPQDSDLIAKCLLEYSDTFAQAGEPLGRKGG